MIIERNNRSWYGEEKDYERRYGGGGHSGCVSWGWQGGKRATPHARVATSWKKQFMLLNYKTMQD
jgi:hypothetical protein